MHTNAKKDWGNLENAANQNVCTTEANVDLK